MLNVEWSVPSLQAPIQHSTLTIQHSSSPSSRGLRLIPISHPVNRIDAIELRIDRLELLADPLDVTVDGALADVVVMRVALAGELAPRLDVAGMTDRSEERRVGKECGGRGAGEQ